jgi:hypothetical protein
MSAYLVAGAALADKARTAITINYLRDTDRASAVAQTPSGGLPRLVTIEVTPEEVGPGGVRLDEASRAKLVAAGVDPEVVERELHGLNRGESKRLADVIYGTRPGAPRAKVDEQLRWFCIAPTEEEEERIARGETVTFLVEG